MFFAHNIVGKPHLRFANVYYIGMSHTRFEMAKELFDNAYRLQMQGDLELAAQFYQRSIELHPIAEAHTYLGAGHEHPPYPDFVTIAAGFRCGTRRISEKKDVDAALEELIDSDGPFVLDVMVPYQEHVLPMIPSGMTVRDIIKA